MLISIAELFQYQFFQNALIASLLASISCGIIGTYIVSKRIVFISGGISHASFGGIGIGYYLGINPIIGAAIFSVFSALGIEFFSKKADIREDSVIAIGWAFGMAIGIIFVFITPGYAPNLMSYLFGSILSVSAFDIMLLLFLNLVIIVFFLAFYKAVLFISFDEEYAKTHRLPVQFLNYALITLVALTIVFNIRVVGIILVISLLTIPQTIANLYTKKFSGIMFSAIVIGLVGTISGLLISYWFNIPSGASIIFFLVLLFLVVKVIRVIKTTSHR